MADGDGLLCVNYRTDRARELLAGLADPGFDAFARGSVDFAAATGMVEYSEAHTAYMTALFPDEVIDDTLGQVVARAGLRQLRLAETEKYPHVTFFFNGGIETPDPAEERHMASSPKVATYDLQPQMSAREVTDRLVSAIRAGDHDFIVTNYANPDMVGHTGDLDAAIRAVETVDACLGEVCDAIAAVGGTMLVCADHGNCETMIDPETGGPHTAHTLNEVPVWLVGASMPLHDGRLADVAPTLLALLDLPQPAAMTGQSLLDEPQMQEARA
jgi:2,3-bisphosphoglycerate-independent phosphoglycerate mutase